MSAGIEFPKVHFFQPPRFSPPVDPRRPWRKGDYRNVLKTRPSREKSIFPLSLFHTEQSLFFRGPARFTRNRPLTYRQQPSALSQDACDNERGRASCGHPAAGLRADSRGGVRWHRCGLRQLSSYCPLFLALLARVCRCRLYCPLVCLLMLRCLLCRLLL